MAKDWRKTKEPSLGDIIEFEECPSVEHHVCNTKYGVYVGDVTSRRDDKFRKIGQKDVGHKHRKVYNGVVLMTKAETKHNLLPNHAHNGVFLIDLSEVHELFWVNNFNEEKMASKPAAEVVKRVLKSVGKYSGHKESLDGMLFCALARYDDDSVVDKLTHDAIYERKPMTIPTSHLAFGTGIGAAMGSKIGVDAMLNNKVDAREEARKHRQQLIEMLRLKMDT